MRFLVFLAVILSFLSTQAQVQGDCGTELDSATYARISSTISLRKSFAGQPRGVLMVPVQHFVFRTSLGSGGITSGDIQDAMDNLNAHYQPVGIQFYECSAVRFVNSSTYYNYSQSQQAQLLASYHANNVLNIYHFNSITSNSGAGLCGYSDFPPGPDIVMMDGSCTLNGSTLSHEVGHYFSLLHTHSTVGGREFVDGTNCSVAGDLLCDTPADPTLSNSNVNTSCIYVGTQRDPNGDLYNPDVRNLMSYSRKSCRNIFSQEQYSMVLFSAVNERDYITCSTIGICNVPANQAENNIDEDRADLSWTAIASNSYEVKYREPGGGWTVRAATSASLSLIGLDCDTEYEWQVRTICVSGGASFWSAPRFFNTSPCVIPCTTPANAEEDALGEDFVDLDWGGVSGVSFFEVQYRVIGGSLLTDTATTSRLLVNGLQCGTAYEWQVRSVCANGGISNWTALRTFTTDSCSPNICDEPIGLTTYHVYTEHAAIGWDIVSDAYYYELRYRETVLPSWNMVNIFADTAIITGLACGTAYEWQVRTYCNSGGSSAWSMSQYFTTDTCLCPVPNAPYAIAPANGSVQVNLVQVEWSFDTCVSHYAFELSYPNEPSFASGASYSLQNYNTNTLLLTSQTGLLDNSTYYWRTKAYNAQGASGYSPTYWFVFNPASGIGEPVNLTHGSLYPNPSRQHINLSIELRNKETVLLVIYNLLGQQVYTHELGEVIGNSNIDINLQNFASGTYLLRLVTPSGSLARKFEVLK